jgi:hypothetical protein
VGAERQINLAYIFAKEAGYVPRSMERIVPSGPRPGTAGKWRAIHIGK